MAWHKRYISQISKDLPLRAAASKVRLLVEFRRPDLLWISPQPLTDPRSWKRYPCPLWISNAFAVAPNILDVMERVMVELMEETEVRAADGTVSMIQSPESKQVWRLRDPQEFFPSRREEEVTDHPFRKSLCTGGTVIGEEGGFLRVEKTSTVSISSLVYKLAIGMTGSAYAASKHIGEMAADAWVRDLERARRLYELIQAAPDGRLLDADVPGELRAASSIGQEVESALLREACRWLGVDPDSPIERRRGRRRKTRGEGDDNSSAGEVIEVTLQPDGSVTGRLIADRCGIAANTNLAGLTLTRLAEILVSVREAELTHDADLLEAYLDAADADWRTKIADEIEIDDGAAAKPDPWTLLGLAPGASSEEVKKAYRMIMRSIHPDTSPLPRWYAQTVNDAYRQLLKELES